MSAKSGIAPELVVSQVRNTAAWLWSDPRAKDAVLALDDLAAAKASHEGTSSDGGTAYFALLLAAHFATVATFVPTDVDARIRHHAWQALQTPDELAAMIAVINRAAAWDVHAVSERVVASSRGPLSGHDGEWLAVRAGALGRAAHINASKELIEELTAQIDAELDREEAICRDAFGDEASTTGNNTGGGRASAARALSVATIVAHNLGDLSRVVAEWPKHALLDSSSTTCGIRDRFVRLGHPDSPSSSRTNEKRALFVMAGVLNKALVAHENHRFLPLRKPRALRSSRSLLLPIGPWLDGWGEAIAKSESLENSDRAEVLAALLEVHARDPAQEGCLRAIAGLHRATRGGIELFIADLPARMRKDALRGRVRDALDITVDHFAARIERRYATERAAAQGGQVPAAKITKTKSSGR